MFLQDFVREEWFGVSKRCTSANLGAEEYCPRNSGAASHGVLGVALMQVV
jgi:hypothetical protein